MNRFITLLSIVCSMCSIVEAREPRKIKPTSDKHYTVVRDIADYERICLGASPTVITFHSPDCKFCVEMEPHFNEVARKYKKAKFYLVNTKDEGFKTLSASLKKNDLPKIEGYPTTHFISPSKPTRVERGGMSAQELDDLSYELAMGQRKPVSLKHSLQESK